MPNLPPGLVPPGKSENLPNILLCFRSVKSSDDKSKKDKDKTSAGDEKSKRNKKRSKSRELRGGVLYVGCECERRNGLQDQCPRSECQGAPECLTHPPTCGPSEFAQGKHIIKYYEQLKKEREEMAKKMNKETGGGDQGSGKKGNEKADYDCFPLDQLMQDGMPCPICDRPMDGCHDKGDKPKDMTIGPIIIDFPVDCLCCPGAS